MLGIHQLFRSQQQSSLNPEKDTISTTMMHKIKKAATTTKGTENAEFADFRGRLENLSSYLRESSSALNESERAWKEVCNRQKVFAEKFANRYPDKDQVRDFSKQSATASQKLVKEFVLKVDGSTAPHWQVDAVVQDYLSEISHVQTEYPTVADAMKEVTMYTKKVDDLQNAKKPDEAKIGRNMEKLEEAKAKYEEILDRVVENMKEVYNKRQVALKATYVAYWSSQLRAFNMLDESLEPTREFVLGAVEPISTLKIGKMSEEDIEEFKASNATVSGSNSSSPASKGSGPPSETGSPTAQMENEVGEKGVPTSPVKDVEQPVAEAS